MLVLGITAVNQNQIDQFLDENGITYIRSATNFITVVFDDKDSNDNFCTSLLENGVIVRSLEAFGLGNCSRITIGTKEENKIFKETFLKVIERIIV